ncbi:MAG: FadR/GntR family transcriptional regulator [Streptosporangiaceae bacterium]
MADSMTGAAIASASPTAWPIAPGPTALSPVPGARDPKLAERIAAAIEADVLQAGWPVGKVIGSEDQLAARYGAGRAVIREAIRLAEHRQVVRMRRGRSGGLAVVEPDASAVTESLAIFLEYARADIDDLIEARTVLEAYSAAAAAGAHLDEGRLRVLREAARQPLGSLAGTAGPGPGLVHQLVAEATGNAALSLFIQVIASLSDRLGTGTAATGSGRSSSAAAVQRRHAAIIAAIAAGDGALAREQMRADMSAMRKASRRLRTEPCLPEAGTVAATTVAAPGRPRPADLVAARIRRDIIDRGWPVGDSLGFEADLLARYGIGRAQFREAVRILENHSVVRMQRGAAGGMLVAAPDGRAVVRVVALYLTYKGMNSAHIRDLREELEAATLRMAIDRLTDDGVRRLNGVLELERTWPDEDFPAVSHDLHAVIAELSGNRTLALLQSIVMQLTAERLHSGDPRRVTEPPQAVRRAHQAIVEAIIARDAPLAQRRMDKHLQAIARWTVEGSARIRERAPETAGIIS